MKRNLSILGTGLTCLDIIYYKGDKLVNNGGSCANVLSVLAQIGWKALVVKPKYDDPWDDFLESNFNILGVGIINDKTVKRMCPRIIEELNDENHFFRTVCPECNKKILSLPRMNINHIEDWNVNFKNFDLFYHDRVSDGVREIVNIMHQNGKLVFYEPNTARNPVILIQDALNSEIVKFSKNNVSMKIADTIRTKAIDGKTKVIINTDGDKGLLFSYLTSDNRMSEWKKIEPFKSNEVIDTSGAGDWLSAGFIDHLMVSWDSSKGYIKEKILVDSIMYGIELAKLCCEKVGAQGVFYSNESMKQLHKLSNNDSKNIKNLVEIQIDNFDNTCQKCLLPID